MARGKGCRRVDDVDVAILRELSRERVVVWGTQDPRLSAQAIARRLSLDPTTVRDRLRAWQKEGFLLGFTVLPNTSLFGAGMASGALRVPDPRAKAGVLAALRRSEGVIGLMDHVGEWIGVGYMDESGEALQEHAAAVAALPGVAEATPPFRVPTLVSTIDLTPLDWRMLRALRAHPREGLAVAAKEAGVSTRTFTRRYERLVEGRALWSIGLYDFGRCEGRVPVQLILTMEDAEAAASGWAALRKAHPGWFAGHVVPTPVEGSPLQVADLYFALPRMGDLDRLVADAWELPGAREVEAYHPLRFEMFGGWADERIAEALGS